MGQALGYLRYAAVAGRTPFRHRYSLPGFAAGSVSFIQFTRASLLMILCGRLRQIEKVVFQIPKGERNNGRDEIPTATAKP